MRFNMRNEDAQSQSLTAELTEINLGETIWLIIAYLLFARIEIVTANLIGN